MLVPPMSKVMASGKPLATATAAAARTPPAGPGQQQGGRQVGGVGDGEQPAGRGHHVHLGGHVGDAAQVGAASGSQRGVHDGGDRALVLAHLGRDLVGAGDVVALLAQPGGDDLLVVGIEVGVQEAHRHPADAVRDRRHRRRVEPLQLLAVAIEPSGAPRGASARGTSGAGRTTEVS